MAFLSIAGIAVDVAGQGFREQEPFRVGAVTRSFNGTPRSSIRAEKREFQFSTPPISQATATSILNAVALGAVVSVTGDFVGNVAFNAIVLVQDRPFTMDGTGFLRVLNITVMEV